MILVLLLSFGSLSLAARVVTQLDDVVEGSNLTVDAKPTSIDAQPNSVLELREGLFNGTNRPPKGDRSERLCMKNTGVRLFS